MLSMLIQNFKFYIESRMHHSLKVFYAQSYNSLLIKSMKNANMNQPELL
jgi:hypothetical protein